MEWLIAFLFVYVTVVTFLYFQQRNLLYHPDITRVDPMSIAAQGAEVIKVKTADGLEIEGWYFAPQDRDHEVIVHFHGNAANSAAWYPHLTPYINAGYGILLAEYRGYGGNPGEPTEQGLYEDARAYIKFLKEEKNIPSSKAVYYGESLGSGVAVQMATEFPPAGIVLEAPFSSLADAAQKIYFYIPVALLLKDHYDNTSKIGNVHAPLMVIHGDADGTIPISLGRKLFDKANEPKRFIEVKNAGHNDLYEYGAALHILEFLSTIPEK